jgi:hypothetical protein
MPDMAHSITFLFDGDGGEQHRHTTMCHAHTMADILCCNVLSDVWRLPSLESLELHLNDVVLLPKRIRGLMETSALVRWRLRRLRLGFDCTSLCDDGLVTLTHYLERVSTIIPIASAVILLFPLDDCVISFCVCVRACVDARISSGLVALQSLDLSVAHTDISHVGQSGLYESRWT